MPRGARAELQAAYDELAATTRHPTMLTASALLVNRSEGRILARSAGTAPASKVLPNALDAMAEIGIPLHRAVPKSIDPDVAQAAETVVVFTGADPVEWPQGLDVRHWDVPSLSGMEPAEVQRVRDDLDLRVRELVSELEGGGRTAPIDG